jgi:hypothetical protein
MEAAQKDRLMQIKTTADVKRSSTPLTIDHKLFPSVFGVVTWYALRKVVDNNMSKERPWKPCTGAFTRSMGLPCHHVCDAKRELGGVAIEDFDEHWFWDRKNVRWLHREPRQVPRSLNLQSLPQASTGRILSSFETVQPTRTLPKCSACQQIGHTRASRHCPTKMIASIAEQSLRLQENEIQQASQASQSLSMPQTPLRTIARASASSTGSFHIANSFSDPFRTPKTRNQPENEFRQQDTVQEASSETLQRTFHMPSPTRSLGNHALGSLGSNITLSDFALALPATPRQSTLSQAVLASPLERFDINCPENVYERYLREKVAWLV